MDGSLEQIIITSPLSQTPPLKALYRRCANCLSLLSRQETLKKQGQGVYCDVQVMMTGSVTYSIYLLLKKDEGEGTTSHPGWIVLDNLDWGGAPRSFRGRSRMRCLPLLVTHFIQPSGHR
ncbi:unnamed protein product [Onchocerca ochengi]|uniref:Protein yippee-like n=1 Tax=Onchocerca ochengi TaxID=42157 RepID=A0A182E6N4_ONCOC|nr:unnamed protein product [Onchocerca ochengi]